MRNIPFSPPDVGEDEAKLLLEVITSGWITTGPKTKEFEKRISEYVGTNKSVCLNSATAAMELTLHLLGIGVGDEVIVPAYTYTASCSVICHVGATPVMIDCLSDSFEMDYSKLEDAITQRTKAIIPVDIAGIMCDYDTIFDIVNRKKHLFSSTNDIANAIGKVAIIADSAHGFGASAKGLKSGQVADFTCYSFHAVKNLTTAEGGAVTWRGLDEFDEEIYKTYQLLSLHGQSKDALSKMQIGSWEYDIVIPAYKCNMTDINAAIGLAQLDRYSKLLERRYEIVKKYDNALKGLPIKVLNHIDKEHISSAHLYFIRINGIEEQRRNEIISELAKYGIATNVHYKPLPMMTAYKNLGFDIKDFPNAYNQYKNEITLPLYSKLSDDDVEYIIEKLKDTLEELKCF